MMACCHLFFGFCVSLMIAAGTSQNTECSLRNYFGCASLIRSMEDVDTLENNKTCQVLQEATSCVKELWKTCGYDCTKEYKDFSRVLNFNCSVHLKVSSGPMDSNLKFNEHPCVILKNLEDCLPNCSPDSVRHLDQVHFSASETDHLQEERQCSYGVVEKYIKGYKTYQPDQLDIVQCTEIKLSNKYFLDDLSMDAGTPQCVGSKVQHMVVDAIGAGVNRYIQLCEDVEPAKCQASLISSSLTAIFAVAIGYTFCH